jgi:DNA polymerase I-like protein with 3'-5' exonuclease and polymerase domains
MVDDMMKVVGQSNGKLGKKVKFSDTYMTASTNLVLDIENYLADVKLRCIGVAGEEGDPTIFKEGLWPPDLSYFHSITCHFQQHDFVELRKLGLIPYEWQGEIHDTIAKAQLIDENRPDYSLKSYASEFGYGYYWKEVHGYWQRREDPPDNILHEYCATDVSLTRDLDQSLSARLGNHPDLERLYRQWVVPCLRLCSELELNGIKISPEAPKAWRSLKRRIRHQENGTGRSFGAGTSDPRRRT